MLTKIIRNSLYEKLERTDFSILDKNLVLKSKN